MERGASDNKTLTLLSRIFDNHKLDGKLFRELKELEFLLKSSQSPFQFENFIAELFRFYDHAPFAVFVLNNQGDCLHVNKAASVRFGCTSDKLKTKCFEEFIVDSNEKNSSEWFKQLLTENETIGEILLKRADGFEYHSSIVANRISDDMILVFSTDVDKEKVMEKTLMDNEAKYKALSEVTNEAIFITDKGFCIECNATASSMFGYSRDEFLGQFATYIVAPESIEIITKNILSGKKEPYEALMKRKDGSKFWAEVHGSNYHYKGIDVRVTSIRDISRRKKYEEDLKQTINTLRESESKIRALSDTTNEAIFFSDKGICVECNQAACKMFGYKYEEIIGIFGTDVIAPESKELVKLNMMSGYEEPYEAMGLRKDGSAFIAEFHGKMYDYKGEKVRITTVRDLTAQKKAEKELKETEQKLRLFAENTNDVIWILNNKLEFVYVSPSIQKILGYLPDQIIGTSLLDILSEKSQSIAHKALDNFISNLKNIVPEFPPRNIELQLIHLNNHMIWTEAQANVILDEQNKIKFITGVSRDITQWKKDEAQLRQAADIIENIQSGIYLYHLEDINDDSTLRMIAANPASERITGLTSDKIVGNTLDENFPELRSMGIPQQYAEVVRTKIPLTIDTIEYEDSRIKPLNVSIKAFPLPNNCVGISFESLTELKKTQNELQIRNSELNNFVYKVSHDLRAPLASIKGLIHLAKYERGSDEYLARIDTSIQKLDDFIRNVLSHSRNLNTQPIVDDIDFRALINHCFSELNYLPGVKRLQKSIKVNSVGFKNDSVRIFEIFRNMISNAIKYQDMDKEKSMLKIEIDIHKKNAKIKIEDNGIGINPEEIDNIFTMFYRASEKSDGSGIGLYIVDQAIQKLNGTIRVKSEIKKGTKFTINIPNLMST